MDPMLPAEVPALRAETLECVSSDREACEALVPSKLLEPAQQRRLCFLRAASASFAALLVMALIWACFVHNFNQDTAASVQQLVSFREDAWNSPLVLELQQLLKSPNAKITQSDYPTVTKYLEASAPSKTGYPERLEAIDRKLKPEDVNQSLWRDGAATKVQCGIDVFQSAAYLMEVVVDIHASLTCSNTTDTSQKVSCASNILSAISNANWLASYLGLAASDCAKSVNTKALCEADITTITACVTEIGGDATAMKEDCSKNSPVPVIHHRARFRRRQGEFNKGLITRQEIKQLPGYRTDRQFDEVQCAIDLIQGLGYIIRGILQLRAAIQTCPDPLTCSANIFNFISSLAWAIEFLALTAADCPEFAKSQNVACMANIADLIAAVGNMVGTAETLDSDCGAPTAEHMKVAETVVLGAEGPEFNSSFNSGLPDNFSFEDIDDVVRNLQSKL